MVTLNTTPNRGYEEPFLGNPLSVDIARIISALRAIDTDMAAAFAQIVAKASLTSPNFDGVPTVPTAAPGTDTGQAASTAFVRAALAALIDSSPGALDTLNELAAALGDDPNFSTTVLTAIGLKADAAATTSALDGKADASHTHTISNVTDLQNALDAAAPVGALGSFARNTAPTGWLKANGAAVSRTTYAALFTAIGTTFGTGDGSTTFNLPDLRGEFIRGWDDSSGVDSGRAFGSSQGHALQNHSHGQTVGSSTAGGSIVGPSSQVSTTQGEVATTRQTTTSGTNGTFTSETRPRNVALLICIKF